MNSEYDFNREVSDKYSLRGRVFHKIRNDILNGRYKEHEELKEIRIGKELGVSRTPVREALRQLELEGLVQIIPNRGAFVTGIQENDVRDIYAIRALLEGLCARWATERITAEQLEAMEENVYLAEFHAGKGHMEQMAELDNQFHHILYDACGSKMLEHQRMRFQDAGASADRLSLLCDEDPQEDAVHDREKYSVQQGTQSDHGGDPCR